MIELHTHAIPGIPILEPERIPLPGEILIGYELVDKSDKLFVDPEPGKMNGCGWISVILSVIFFWPASCVPCFMSCSYSKYQRPVYEYKKD